MDQDLIEVIRKSLELILFMVIWNAWVVKDYLLSPLLWWLLGIYARLRRTTVDNVLGVRARLYVIALFLQWGLTLCVLSLWMVSGRSWSALGLGTGAPLRCGIGFALAGLHIMWWWNLHRRVLLTQPEWLEPVRLRLATEDDMPRTSGERWGFTLVAVTAGVCEELLFRGYVMWYVEIWTGTVAAVAISSVLFGFAHLHSSLLDVIRPMIVGLLFALVVLAAGSLWPAMLMHAATDLIAGDFAYRMHDITQAVRPDSAP